MYLCYLDHGSINGFVRDIWVADEVFQACRGISPNISNMGQSPSGPIEELMENINISKYSMSVDSRDNLYLSFYRHYSKARDIALQYLNIRVYLSVPYVGLSHRPPNFRAFHLIKIHCLGQHQRSLAVQFILVSSATVALSISTCWLRLYKCRCTEMCGCTDHMQDGSFINKHRIYLHNVGETKVAGSHGELPSK